MSRMRLRIAQRLKDAQNVNAMLTTFNEVDMRQVLSCFIHNSVFTVSLYDCCVIGLCTHFS